jgi:hypothetical protein
MNENKHKYINYLELENNDMEINSNTGVLNNISNK